MSCSFMNTIRLFQQGQVLFNNKNYSDIVLKQQTNKCAESKKRRNKSGLFRKGSNLKYQKKSEIIFVGDLWNNVENIKED